MMQLLILVTMSVPLAMTMNSRLFHLVTSSNGEELCALDKPIRSYWLPTFDRDVPTPCGLRCLADENCLAFNINNLTGQCDMFSCHYPSDFTTAVPGCRTYVTKGYEHYPRDCNDVMLYCGKLSGVYKLYSVKGNISWSILAYCDMDTTSGGWTVFQRRMNGSVDFYRNWANYATGFGQPDGEFWLGNDNIHRLTSSKRYRLRIDMTDFDGNTRYAEYDNFVVDDVTNKYKLSSLGVYSGTAGDAMQASTTPNGNAIGMFFTTNDRDNDLSSSNCARSCSGAWWYKSCHSSNLNGLYMPGTVAAPYGGRVISWQLWRGNSYSMNITEMKIRPF